MTSKFSILEQNTIIILKILCWRWTKSNSHDEIQNYKTLKVPCYQSVCFITWPCNQFITYFTPLPNLIQFYKNISWIVFKRWILFHEFWTINRFEIWIDFHYFKKLKIIWQHVETTTSVRDSFEVIYRNYRISSLQFFWVQFRVKQF